MLQSLTERVAKLWHLPSVIFFLTLNNCPLIITFKFAQRVAVVLTLYYVEVVSDSVEHNLAKSALKYIKLFRHGWILLTGSPRLN